MLSKAKIKLIHSLAIKKYRDETGLFVAEGAKSVLELAQYFTCEMLCAESDWLTYNNVKAKEVIELKGDELRRISFLKTPQGVLAVFRKPYRCGLGAQSPRAYGTDLSLALDGIQDPGNLGTIVRIADWFGVRHIFCSEHCADVFNPKTVQATMGALGRVNVHYVDLAEFISAEMQQATPVFGAFLDGENIYQQRLPAHGLIVVGSEGNGISPAIGKLIKHRLFIPPYPAGEPTSESLNVAVATAIICGEFRRQLSTD